LISVVIIPLVSIVITSSIHITLPEPVRSPEPKVFAPIVMSLALEPGMLALSTKVAPKSLRPAQSSETRGSVKVENSRAAHP
jgi:hypothetical protein